MVITSLCTNSSRVYFKSVNEGKYLSKHEAWGLLSLLSKTYKSKGKTDMVSQIGTIYLSFYLNINNCFCFLNNNKLFKCFFINNLR